PQPPSAIVAEYRFRRGRHELVLTARGATPALVEAVARGEAEFALIVEGPLLVLGYRFGTAVPWSATAPFYWHLLPSEEQVLPAKVGPWTPDLRSRMWSTLWVTLIEGGHGRVLARRALALDPEFTRALHEAIRQQAAQPFSGAAADHALAWLNHSGEALPQRALRRTRCAPVGPGPGPGPGH
ncbi:MAG: hypothetical protein IRY99_22550, partial [Isosphaeraceae bacterium]|nr:hypothetical protein [Isosphaeraceae bacterium]